MSTLVNDGLMRPIKEIQDATHFKKVMKKDLVDQGLLTDEEEGEAREAGVAENAGAGANEDSQQCVHEVHAFGVGHEGLLGDWAVLG